MKRLKLTTLLTLALCAAQANGAITGTFVAAEDGTNSFLSSDGTTTFSTSTGTGTLWQDRPGVFNITSLGSSGAYQGNPGDAEVITTITGLTIGQSYEIYVIHGVNTSGSNLQNIDAGFTSGALTTFTEAAATDTGETLDATDWEAYESLVGTAVADASGEIEVFVQAANPNERSVYNGISYVAVPEPSSAALLGIGGLALILRRRK